MSVPPSKHSSYELASLLKADLHVHAESAARLDRIVARRQGGAAYDWGQWVDRVRVDVPPGMPRLDHMIDDLPADLDALDAIDLINANFVQRIVELLTEAAVDGAILIEIRFGRSTLQRPDFLSLVREAERRVRLYHPRLRTSAVLSGLWPPVHDREGRLLQACVQAAREGLGGVDLIPVPYDQEADWRGVYQWAERAAAAGLDITVHAGEFSMANLDAAVRLPGLKRLGHAVHLARDPRLLADAGRRNITVECCLTSNVVLGAVPSLAEHPLPDLLAAGIPVALGTDNPLRVQTTIGREYAAAHTLGCSTDDLLGLTRHAIAASFLPAPDRTALLRELSVGEVRS